MLMLTLAWKVLGEIRRPRKTFPISMMAAASILATLYLAVNICYVSLTLLTLSHRV